jgi:hypothetical protein
MKVGAAVAALPPVALPVIDAIGAYMEVRTYPPDMMTGIRLAFASWIDSLAIGYGMVKPFSSVTGPDTSGISRVYPTTASPPKGLFLVTTAIGVGAMIASAIQSRLVRFAGGVRQVRIFNRRVA